MRRSLELFIVFYISDVRRFLDYSLRFCATESGPRRGCRSLLFWLHKSHVCAGLETSDGNVPQHLKRFMSLFVINIPSRNLSSIHNLCSGHNCPRQEIHTGAL
jgi:hypothetical protein